MKRFLAILAVSFALTPVTQGASLNGPSIANIFGAGQAVPPGGATFGAGILPPSHSFTAGPGKVLQFTNIGGMAGSVIGGNNLLFNADGFTASAAITTDMNSQQGISGIRADSAFFLAGVFLDSSQPNGAPPPSLDFTASGLGLQFLSLSPQLSQMFFIGDGQTNLGGGTTQSFFVPPTATRLFLGVADGLFNGTGLVGDPDTYTDNVGGYTAQFTIVPEPSTAFLAGAAVAGVTILTRRARHQLPA